MFISNTLFRAKVTYLDGSGYWAATTATLSTIRRFVVRHRLNSRLKLEITRV